MQSTPGDRQPLEDEGLKAGQRGREEAVSHITHHMYWPIKHIQWVWPGKQCRVAVRACMCAHTSVYAFMTLCGFLCANVCAVSGMGFSVDDERQ